jgi:hypothetical protein
MLHRPKLRRFLARWFVTNSVLTGLLALLWLLLRSGARPSRLAYPCQRAALSTAYLAFASPLLAALIEARDLAARLLRSRAGLAAATAGLLATCGILGVLARVDASPAPDVQPPADYRAQVFHVTDCPEEPDGERFPGVDNLFTLMARRGLKLYRSAGDHPWAGPEGLFSADDVIIIKINYQWTGRGGTNVLLLSGLIRCLLDHPDGFTGEIVVCENGQFVSTAGFDRSYSNNGPFSPHRVVIGYQDQGFQVSDYEWTSIRGNRAYEYSEGDQEDGYVLSTRIAGGVISYPKFTTELGTRISARYGIWSPDAQSYDRDRLKVINLPVLKSHHRVYGVTACVKNYMGLVTDSLGTNSHDGIASGLLGAVMAEIGPPTLNILDCLYVKGDPYGGPDVYSAPFLGQLVASTDPVAADIWATTNILIPAFLDNGFSPPWPFPRATPDDPDSKFRRYLDRSMGYLLDGGYAVTNDVDQIDLHSWDGVSSLDRPRRGLRRARSLE